MTAKLRSTSGSLRSSLSGISSPFSKSSNPLSTANDSSGRRTSFAATTLPTGGLRGSCSSTTGIQPSFIWSTSARRLCSVSWSPSASTAEVATTPVARLISLPPFPHALLRLLVVADPAGSRGPRDLVEHDADKLEEPLGGVLFVGKWRFKGPKFGREQ